MPEGTAGPPEGPSHHRHTRARPSPALGDKATLTCSCSSMGPFPPLRKTLDIFSNVSDKVLSLSTK